MTSGGDSGLSLFTDLYQLTMVETYLAEEMTAGAVFDLSIRTLPPTRNFLLMAGLADVVSYLEGLCFDAQQLEYLASLGLFSQRLFDFLADFRFQGSLHAVPDGSVVFAGEPLLQVVAPLPHAQLIETFVINQIALQTMLASKGARVVLAAGGRNVIDFGARRTHGIDAGLKAARTLYMAGFDATSNVQAGQRYGVPVAGTMAHSFVQAHDSELDALRAFTRRYPSGTLLVDTYDTVRGVENVVRLARELGDDFQVGGIRLDSGDLAELSRRARSILDEAGLEGVQIFASGGLDEYGIDELLAAGSPIDGFGVGTNVGTSADAPTLECVYKLASYDGSGRLKVSPDKVTLPHRKQVFRDSAQGTIRGDVVTLAGETSAGQPLLQPIIDCGTPTTDVDLSLAANRERAAQSIAALPNALRARSSASPYPVEVSPALQAEAERITAEQLERNTVERHP